MKDKNIIVICGVIILLIIIYLFFNDKAKRNSKSISAAYTGNEIQVFLSIVFCQISNETSYDSKVFNIENVTGNGNGFGDNNRIENQFI